MTQPEKQEWNLLYWSGKQEEDRISGRDWSIASNGADVSRKIRARKCSLDLPSLTEDLPRSNCGRRLRVKPAGLCTMPSVMLLSFFLSKGTLTSWTAAASAEFLEPELKHPTCVTCTPSHLHWFALRTKCHTAGHVIALWSSSQWTGRCPIEAAQGKFRTAFISWSNLDKWERGDGREVDGCIVLSFLFHRLFHDCDSYP